MPITKRPLFPPVNRSGEVPFCRVDLMGSELEFAREALASGYFAGDGRFTHEVRGLVEKLLGAPAVLLTTSCTAALELAALLIEVGPGDEVILPSFTFVSTANAFVLRGATPVFVDIDPATLNLDHRLVAKAITPRTKAIVPVHYAGVACEMNELLALAQRHRLAIIEDAAQGFLGTYRGRHLGAIGDLGCFSFHETKTFTCGEGGALVLNRPDLIERAEILREKGTNRSAFFRGEVDKYTWIDVGSSFLPSDMLAGILLGQIKARETIFEHRRAIFERYWQELRPLEERGYIRLCQVPPECTINYHMFWLLAGDDDERTALLTHLRTNSVHATFHYVPLHSAPFAHRLGIQAHLPVTDDIASRLVRLPMFTLLDLSSQDRVIAAVRSFYGA